MGTEERAGGRQLVGADQIAVRAQDVREYSAAGAPTDAGPGAAFFPRDVTTDQLS